MPSPYVTELALRAAVNNTKRELTSEGGQSESIKDVALKRARDQITGSSDVSSVGSQISLQSIAIEVAVAGISLAYTAISKQLDVLDNQRLGFDKERQAGIATFMVPSNVEESDLSTEEKVIKGFLELSFRNPSFCVYLGIHSAELLTEKGSRFYSILPFYRMSEALGQPVASTRPLDRQRTAINLFFRSALPDAIADIDTSFQMDWRFISFWESTIQRKNYLNNRRAPRFIMLCLSNLLWNLQHPVDPDTGFPLGLNRCIEMCREVELYLNQLLNSESPPYLENISTVENGLMSFMRKLEIHTKALKAAYAEEQLHELNIDEITNSAHRALRIMDKSVFKLIYKRYNPITGKDEPDEKAAEELAYTVSYLNQLLIRNAELIGAFRKVPGWISAEAMLNTPPLTIVDVLIIFCHLSYKERNELFERIEKSPVSSALEFSQTLKKFDRKFVKPVKAFSKQELGARFGSSKVEDVGRLTAGRLVPLITLVIEDYRVEVDTPVTYAYAKQSEESETAPPIHSGKQQVHHINASAALGEGYYQWILSPFLNSTGDTSRLDELPKHQYRMTQITKLMDSVSELVQNYRSFLQHKSFQRFLLTCLNKVKEEYAKLDAHIDEADSLLAQDELMSRSLQAILRPMMSDLNRSLEAFGLATANFERVVSAPDFTDQQRQLLSTKLGSISDQFQSLFSEDSGVLDLMRVEDTEDPQAGAAPVVGEISPTTIVESRKVLALRKLVQSCYDALSYQSRHGHKGVLMCDLLTMIDRKPNFTEGQVKYILVELMRVTASYRDTWFFQADYARTRSTMALIKAIKDKQRYGILPLAGILFGNAATNMSRMSDTEIFEKLRALRETNHWQESCHAIQITWPDAGDFLRTEAR